jgi:hypothetical protein
MAQYTVEAFRWSGTGYNAQYNTSYTAVFDDDDPAYEGRNDSSETVSIGGGAFNGTAGAPYAITIPFTAADGGAHTETFYFFYTSDGGWHFVPGPGSEFSVGATLGFYQSHTIGWDYADVTCFARGTLIETDRGPVPVERLLPGHRVVTADGRLSVLRMVLSRSLDAEDLDRQPAFRPVRIARGALGGGLPLRDLRVSRQHRMLVHSRISERMITGGEALVAAIRLAGLPGIAVEPSGDGVTYYHLIFDTHETVLAEGAPSESLYLGPEALKAIPAAALTELQLLFPWLAEPNSMPEPARPIPALGRQKQLAARHRKNARPLLECYRAPQRLRA